MSSPKYKLTYFPIPGRAGPIRNAFKYLGVDFEDAHVKGPDWPALKPKTPWGGVPTLETEGRTIGQSNAILFFVAGLGDGSLLPASRLDQAEALELCSAVEERAGALNPTFSEKDEEKKIALRGDWQKTKMEPLFASLDKKLANSKSGFLVGEKLSFADLKVSAAVGYFSSGLLDGVDKEVLGNYSNLGRHLAAVTAALKKE